MERLKESNLQPPQISKSSFDRKQNRTENSKVDVSPEVQIPWRTSLRMQEFILKFYQKRQDSSINSSLEPNKYVVKKELVSPPSNSIRSHKAQHSTSGTSMEEKKVLENNIQESEPARRSGRKRKVHFGKPLVLHIEENGHKSSASNSDSTSTSKISKKSVSENKPRKASDGSKKLVSADKPSNEQVSAAIQSPEVASQQGTQHVSSFFLVCNHIGLKGWRCYRGRLAGDLLCSHHQNDPRRKSLSL